VTPAARENHGEIGEAAKEIDESEAGHGASNEVAGNERPQRRPDAAEVVAVPERRPWKDDQQEPDLQKERDVDQAADQKTTLKLVPSLNG
jgi:hypothetical protein